MDSYVCPSACTSVHYGGSGMEQEGGVVERLLQEVAVTHGFGEGGCSRKASN